MRVSAVVLVFALLAVCVSAVPVPYKWCGSSSDDATLTSIVSNEFPPVKGDTLSLNVTGNLSKEVTSGQYTIAITVGGFPLPDLTGDIDSFRPLPWPVGDLNFTYSQGIPSAAPSGNYNVKISAVDQDSTQIFCISISFTLKAVEGDVNMHSIRYTNQQQQSDEQPRTLPSLVPVRPIQRRQPVLTNNEQRVRPELKMTKMKPIKPINRNW